jgi:protein O-GlcNAc transferase
MDASSLIQSAFGLYHKGNLQQSEIIFKQVLQQQPYNFNVLFILGILCYERLDLEQAMVYFERSLQIKPNNADTYYCLGNIFLIQNNFKEALYSYNKAVAINPDHADAISYKGLALQMQGNNEEALESYYLSLQINPNSDETYNNLGNLLIGLGHFDEAETCFRRAMQINPLSSMHYSNLLLAMLYNSRYDARTIFSEHLKFAQQFEKPLLTKNSPHISCKTFSYKLKLGYVSPDFKKHSVAYFIEPILAAHNRECFEIYCYSILLAEDEATKRLHGYADHWRNITAMSDEEAAELIRNDGIDILIDLAGHTGRNRILLFAYKPAPVQVSWIGYPATTGLSTMDYKIVDKHTDPLGMTERFYTEKLVYMPESFLCYLPEKGSPEVGSLPALSSGHITFGSFNNFTKVSPGVIELWAKIMKTIPYSKLIMKAKSLADKSNREYVLDIFTRNGIGAEQIELLSWESSIRDHLDTYNRIDIGLDTFPYNGVTTTCEAMCMGVPVITLEGNTHASRVGVSLLSNVGLTQFIAKTPEEYLGIAVNLAKNIAYLQSLRERLRDMMTHSPLTDSKRFIVNLEMRYRTMWDNWCKTAQT